MLLVLGIYHIDFIYIRVFLRHGIAALHRSVPALVYIQRMVQLHPPTVEYIHLEGLDILPYRLEHIVPSVPVR